MSIHSVIPIVFLVVIHLSVSTVLIGMVSAFMASSVRWSAVPVVGLVSAVHALRLLLFLSLALSPISLVASPFALRLLWGRVFSHLSFLMLEARAVSAVPLLLLSRFRSRRLSLATAAAGLGVATATTGFPWPLF